MQLDATELLNHVGVDLWLLRPARARVYSDIKMTSYIPSLTLPGFIFEQPALAVLLPIGAGTAVGFNTRPKETQDYYMALKQPPYRPPPKIFGPM